MNSVDGASRRSPRATANVTIKLLHGTLASMRCKELIKGRRLQEAREQLSVLRCVIDEVTLEPLDDDGRIEIELLRAQELKLRAALFGSGEPSPA